MVRNWGAIALRHARRANHYSPPIPLPIFSPTTCLTMFNATLFEYGLLASVLVTFMGSISYETPSYNPGE